MKALRHLKQSLGLSIIRPYALDPQTYMTDVDKILRVIASATNTHHLHVAEAMLIALDRKYVVNVGIMDEKKEPLVTDRDRVYLHAKIDERRKQLEGAKYVWETGPVRNSFEQHVEGGTRIEEMRRWRFERFMSRHQPQVATTH